MTQLATLLRSRGAWAGLGVGVALLAVVIAWQGIADVIVALHRAGWGMLIIALLHLPQLWADAVGWSRLFPPGQRPRFRTTFLGRWVGESINDLLPVLQMGGNIVKSMMLMDRGVHVGKAGASVVVDVTLVVLSQIVFTLFGLCLAAPYLHRGGSLLAIVAGVVIIAILLGGFYIAQRRGFFGLMVRVSRRMLGEPHCGSAANGAATIDAEILWLYGQRRLVMSGGCWHLLGWFLGVGEVWFALQVLGHPVSIGTALLFESLAQAIRTGAFAVPGALGVQEGGYVLMGSALGIEPGVALALSFARRIRELLLGLPGLAVWQASIIRRKVIGGGDAQGKHTLGSQ
jgi:putative membrane protein